MSITTSGKAGFTSRERLLTLLRGEKTDCVPVCPDISNMVPCRLTGKPFWDIYAYEDPPLWKAHIDALKYFDIDGGFELYNFGPVDPLTGEVDTTENYIVHRYEDGRFIMQNYNPESDRWARTVTMYTKGNPPASNVEPAKLGLSDTPKDPEPLTGVKPWPVGMERWLLIREELGDQGVLGMKSGMGTSMMGTVEAVYAFHDNPQPFFERAERMMADVERRMELLAASTIKPDFLLCGGSGTLIFQTPEIVRKLVLPVLKKTTALAYDMGIPTHIHSCGPETELVRMAAEETMLTVIDPLEISPMGDCDLAELKRRYGEQLILKGNLHTTKTMLNGSVDEVIEASKRAIDDGAAGGKFILSTGDQCGRDTPDENIRAMVETARTYGRY
jgi:uroporphyrinogen decarboxylase